MLTGNAPTPSSLSSVLIAAERKRIDLPRLFAAHSRETFFIAAITAAELLHGVERAQPVSRRNERSAFVEAVLFRIPTIDFDLGVARRHAAIWAVLEKQGQMIGAHDLLIAATALRHDHAVVTLNRAEFGRVSGLRSMDPAAFLVA